MTIAFGVGGAGIGESRVGNERAPIIEENVVIRVVFRGRQVILSPQFVFVFQPTIDEEPLVKKLQLRRD